MGAKTWMLVIAQANARDALAAKPALDHKATHELAERLFPEDKLEYVGTGDLSFTSPPKNEIFIGCFDGVSVIAAKEFGMDYPSRLPERFLTVVGNGTVTLHAMHSVVDWFAYANWVNGRLMRSLSLSPDDGILEDIGPHLPFEEPYWSGEYPAVEGEEDAYPFPFHPLDLSETALKALFGYQLEGEIDETLLDPTSIPLLRFRRRPSPWWKFW